MCMRDTPRLTTFPHSGALPASFATESAYSAFAVTESSPYTCTIHIVHTYILQNISQRFLCLSTNGAPVECYLNCNRALFLSSHLLSLKARTNDRIINPFGCFTNIDVKPRLTFIGKICKEGVS